MVQNTGDNKFSTADWIVSPTAYKGTHTTITAALSSASSGDTIFLNNGTYTEDFTLKAGVLLTSFSTSEDTGNVKVVGKITVTAAGTYNISNIYLQTNSDYIIECTGSNLIDLSVDNCYLNVLDNIGISFTNSNASTSIQFYGCVGTQASTYAMSVSTSVGILGFTRCTLGNGGGTVAASTTSAGLLAYDYCLVVHPISSSSTGSLSGDQTRFGLGTLNLTAITNNGSVSGSFYKCSMESGTASAVSIGTGSTSLLYDCGISSTNTNAITGAGTVKENSYFTATSSLVNTTTKQNIPQSSGGISFDHGTNTLSSYEEGTWTPVLTGSSVAPDTITYTQQIGIYTVVGDLVWVHARIQVNAFTLGSGAGQLRLEGFPYTAKNVTGLLPVAPVELSGVDYATAGASVTGQLQSNTKSMAFAETIDNAAVAFIALSGLAAGDAIMTTFMYKWQ